MLHLSLKGKWESANLVTLFLTHMITRQKNLKGREKGVIKKIFSVQSQLGSLEKNKGLLSHYRFDSNPCVTQHVLMLWNRTRQASSCGREMDKATVGQGSVETYS